MSKAKSYFTKQFEKNNQDRLVETIEHHIEGFKNEFHTICAN